MYEQIGYPYDGITVIFSDRYIHNRAVFFCDDAVQCQGQCHPLILLDAAIIVSI